MRREDKMTESDTVLVRLEAGVLRRRSGFLGAGRSSGEQGQRER